MSESYPCGRCQCDGHKGQEGGCKGPAAFEATREGKRMLLCTRCDLPTDHERKLLVTRAINATAYFMWDSLGFFMLSMLIQQEEEAAEKAKEEAEKAKELERLSLN